MHNHSHNYSMIGSNPSTSTNKHEKRQHENNYFISTYCRPNDEKGNLKYG